MRRGLPAFAWFLLFPLAVSAAAAEPPRDVSPLLDSSRDEVVRVAKVPSAESPHAEVRILRRGDAAVVQTLIVSRLLKRVVGEIRKKETSRWSPGRRERRDSLRYVDRLERAYRTVEERFRKRGARDDRRRKLLIEFILSGDAAVVAFLDPEIEGDFGRFRVGGRGLLEVLPLSRRYVRGDMYEIVRDSFGMSRREAEETLKPLLPAALQLEGKRGKPEEGGEEAQ